MTTEELKHATRLCIEHDDDINVEVFIVLKNHEIRKANFLHTLQPEIITIFKPIIATKILDADYSLLNVSSADERRNAIYYYDLDLTEQLLIFHQVLNGENNFPYFSFEHDEVNNIDAFLFVIGNAEHQIVLYKRLASVNIYQQRTGLFIRKEDNQFAKLESDVIKIVPQIDAFMVNGAIFFLNLTILENAFHIHDVVKTSARQQIALLEDYGLIENIDSLEMELENISFARKFSKLITNSPVLGKVDNHRIVDFTTTHPALCNKFKYNADRTKIKLTTKLSKKLFVKLLNDDYLTSNLTEQYYDSMAKDVVSILVE